LNPYLDRVSGEREAYGYHIEIVDRSSPASAVRNAFIKDDSLGTILWLSSGGRHGPLRKIQVKIEIDTTPPGGNGI